MFKLRVNCLLACVVTSAMLVSICGVSTHCRADDGVGDAKARDARNAELDKKIGAVRDQLKTLRAKWNEASAQAKKNVAAELNEASKELEGLYKETEAAYEETFLSWGQSLERAWKEIEDGEELAAAEAEQKLNAARARWSAAYRQLRKTHRQRVAYYRGKLTGIEKRITEASQELSAEMVARRSAARKNYEANSKAMRASYEQSIQSLRSEVERLRAASEKAERENQEKLQAVADSLAQSVNELQAELQASYRETSEKASSYLEQTRTKLSDAAVEVRDAMQAEADEVATATTKLNAEMVECCEAYRASIDKQVADAKTRVADAKGAAKQRIEKVQSQLEESSNRANEQLAYAYRAYVTALEQEIDHMQSRIAKADQDSRDRMVRAIELRQSDLEKAKQKLKEK